MIGNSMKLETVCMLLCAITINLLPTHIPHSVGGSSCGRGDELTTTDTTQTAFS